jgi:hypothetical protein
MPHGHLSCLQTLPQGLVNSQELEIPWVSLSGTAFAFLRGQVTLLQGRIAMDNHDLECSLQAGAFAYSDSVWLEGRGRGKVEQAPLNEKGDTCCN